MPPMGKQANGKLSEKDEEKVFKLIVFIFHLSKRHQKLKEQDRENISRYDIDEQTASLWWKKQGQGEIIWASLLNSRYRAKRR